MAKVTLQGNEVNTNGELPAVGSPAPDFKLTNGDLQDVSLADFKGKKKLLNVAVMLDTSTCAISSKKFNDAAKNRDDLVVLVITADLPATQARFCEAEHLDSVVPLSMMRDRNFAKDYGILQQDGPLTGLPARAVIIIDENDKVIYTQLVPEITEEPDYESALAAL